MTDLSGRVDTLEERFTTLQQDLLQKVDLTAQSAYAQVINQQITQFSNLLETLETQYKALQGLYQNLVYQENNRWTSFTGHTGDVSLHS